MRVRAFHSAAKWAVSAAICLLAPVLISAQEFDFRGTSWGMTAAQVLVSESDEPYESTTDSLVYSVEVAGLEAYTVYSFIDDTLVFAGYVFAAEHSNDNLYIKDYEKVKSIISRKYGEPSKDDLRWSNDLYRDREDNYGRAISAGHMTMTAIWHVEGTMITLGLSGDNYEISHFVSYASTAHFDLIERKKQQEEDSAF